MKPAWLWLALVAGCAAAPEKPVAPPSTSTELDRDARALRALEQELYGTELEPARPDCRRACELESRICQLAGRICVIAERHRDQADAQAKCQDAQSRCTRARTHVAARCACPR